MSEEIWEMGLRAAELSEDDDVIVRVRVEIERVRPPSRVCATRRVETSANVAVARVFMREFPDTLQAMLRGLIARAAE